MARTERRTVAAIALAIVVCAGLQAGCGNSRTPVPSLTRPAAPGGFRTLRFPAAGVSIAAPRGWQVIAERPPLLTTVASGDAVIALWRYPRSGPPPNSRTALAAARASLLTAIRARQGTVQVLSSRITRIDGAPAIESDALETIGGAPRQVLSTHVFQPTGEVVLEEYAPPAVLNQIRHPLFARVRRSLAIISTGQ
jgi:hypothetical protein